jgi:hypothetical protein
MKCGAANGGPGIVFYDKHGSVRPFVGAVCFLMFISPLMNHEALLTQCENTEPRGQVGRFNHRSTPAFTGAHRMDLDNFLKTWSNFVKEATWNVQSMSFVGATMPVERFPR